jgi:mRNA interferase HigB
MKVLGRNKLIKFSKKHANVKTALDAWFEEVSKPECRWRTSHDIKAPYPSADFLANNRVIFNIKGNHYRLVVKVGYQSGIVVIEWVGTHAEYDKQTF